MQPTYHIVVLLLACGIAGVLADIKIGALLPVSTTDAGPLNSALIRLAAQQVNANGGIVGQQLEVTVIDSASDPTTTIYDAFELANGTFAGVIGEYTSTLTQYAQYVLGKANIPQIAPSATSSVLTDKTSFPTLVRTMADNAQQADALVSLVTSFGWTTVSVIADGLDLYSNDLSSLFVAKAQQKGLTIDSYATIGIQNIDADKAITLTATAHALIVMLFTPHGDESIQVLEAAARAGILGKDSEHTWILGDAAAATIDGAGHNGASPLPAALSSENVLGGLIGVLPPSGVGSDGYTNFLSLLDASTSFDPALSAGSSTFIFPYATAFYDAVGLLSAAFSEVLSNGGSVNDGAAVLQAIETTTFSGVNGHPFAATYDLYNWVNHFQKVATIDPNSSVPPTGVIFPDGTTNIPSDLSRDIIIGVIYPFSTLAGLTANWYSLTRLAFDQINAQQVVPGYKFKAIYADDQSQASVGIDAALTLRNVEHAVAFLGPLQSSVSEPVAQVISNFKIPVLSFVSTAPELSDKVQYPYFVRNVPPDTFQAGVMAQLMLKFGWTHVSVINTRDQYGLGDSAAFVQQCIARGIQVIAQQSFNLGTLDMSALFTAIRDSGTRVVVTFVEVNNCYQTFVEMKRAGILGVAGWSVITSDTCASFGSDAIVPANVSLPEWHESLVGVFSVLPFVGGGPTFDAFLESLAAENATIYPKLLPLQVYSSYGYDAPWMYAYAFNRMLMKGIPFTNGTALLAELYATNFTGITGLTLLNEDGDRIGPYTLLNWKCLDCNVYTDVGMWDPAVPNDFDVHFENIIFIGNNPTIPSDVVPGFGDALIILGFEDKLSIAMGVITGICVIVWMLVVGYFIFNYQFFTRYSTMFCSIILIGVGIGYVAILTVFPYPTPYLCMAFPWLTGIAFVLVYGSIFTKTLGLWRIFAASKKLQKTNISKNLLTVILGTGVIIETGLMIGWVISDSPNVLLISTFNSNTSYYTCAGKSLGFWIAFIALKGVYLIGGVFLAFKVRNIMDEFNESKAIAMCIYNATAVGILAIPLGFLLRPINGAVVLIQSVALLFAFTFPLIAIFVPKIIYIRASGGDMDINFARRFGGNTTSSTVESGTELESSSSAAGNSK